MKPSRIVGATLVACLVVLTLMDGRAQAQSLSSDTLRVEEDEGASVIHTEITTGDALVGDPNRFFTGVCTIGPRSGDVIFTCLNIGFTNASPRLVLCQTRNNPADPSNYPDQFACQVISTSSVDNGSVTVRIRRIDDGTDSSGWTQNLQIDLLIVN